MSCGPYTFISRAITDHREEKGSEVAATKIQEFYLARSRGADAEIDWLASYFGFKGMEELADSAIISDIITRELLSDSDEIISCSSCGRLFVERAGSTQSFIPEPCKQSDTGNEYKLLSEADVEQQR